MVVRFEQPLRPKASYVGYEQLKAGTNNPGLYCLSPTTWLLVWTWLSDYGYWRTRYIADKESLTPETIIDSEWDEIQQWVDLAFEELGCDMSCTFEEVLSQQALILGQIAKLIASQNKVDCPDVICIDPDTINPDGTDYQDPIEGDYGPGDEIPPDGFDTMEDYLQYKCEAANLIFDAVTAGLRTTGALTSVLAVGQVIAAALISATASGIILLPPLAFAGLVAAFVAVLAAGVGSTIFLSYLADEMDGERDEIVCRLYEAQNTTAAINSVIDVVENLIEAAVIAAAIPGGLVATVTDFIGLVVSQFFNIDVVNQLFQLTADIAYAGADCSGCDDEPCDWILSTVPFMNNVTVQPATMGTGTITEDGETFIIDSSPITYNSGATSGHIICLCVRGAVSYAGSPGPPSNGQTVPDCDNTLWIRNVGASVANVSTDARGQAGGVLASLAFPGTNNLHVNDYHILHITRSNAAGGAFQMSFRLHPS
jgi:hypothetical protein